ncbi:hypothetical protein [Massilia aquatica]|uniref:Uncharacterized protein n=1 Tax=Massilia aquatica TaxID=2609000 RepID=A0ABX0M5X1_9BURK|nr:hypothetical protein [Massilia aquatica]NHZ42626.1 hypothetical protein [Massilia aquatica]
MRHVVSIPGLRVLDVLDVVKPGRLEGWQFDDAMAEQTSVGAAVAKNASGLMLSPPLRRNEMHWRRATNTF